MNEAISISVNDVASKILIATGVLQLLCGLVTGLPMGMLRMNGKEVPRYLTLAHMGGLMQGPLLLGLVLAVALSSLSSIWEAGAAGLIAGASILLVLKDTLNWKMGIEDEFAERPAWFALGVALGPMYLVGMGIMAVGVLMGILA